jgi:hypothetical protein
VIRDAAAVERALDATGSHPCDVVLDGVTAAIGPGEANEFTGRLLHDDFRWPWLHLLVNESSDGVLPGMQIFYLTGCESCPCFRKPNGYSTGWWNHLQYMFAPISARNSRPSLPRTKSGGDAASCVAFSATSAADDRLRISATGDQCAFVVELGTVTHGSPA